MVSWAPHTQGGISHPTFASDNRKVADVLTAIVKNTNAWTWMKGITSVCNGRFMFTNLKTHYLGASTIDNIVYE